MIGYVGRLAPEKQVEDLRAVADLPGTKLVIVGDGPSRAALEKLLPNATFLGFQSGDELAESYASFDVFVHPGENETFCQTVQEALASGVPVVATGRGGPLDLVQNSRTGWLYRPGDLDDLRARVLDLTGDAAKRRAFALAARDSVAHRTWASLGDELLGHYADAIALKRGARRRRSRMPRRVARAGRDTWRSATPSPRDSATTRVRSRGSTAAGPTGSRCCCRTGNPGRRRCCSRTWRYAAARCPMCWSGRSPARSNCAPTSSRS